MDKTGSVVVVVVIVWKIQVVNSEIQFNTARECAACIKEEEEEESAWHITHTNNKRTTTTMMMRRRRREGGRGEL